MRNCIIPKCYLEAFTTTATLFGVILAVLTIAQSITDEQSVAWAVLGFIVAVFGAFGIADRLFGFFGRGRRNEKQLQRLVGGGSTIVLFAILSVMLGFFVLP